MSYTTYLFDFDYTLADSSRGIVTCFRNVLDLHGYTKPTDEDIKRTIGKTLEDSFSILTGVTDARQLADFKKEYVKQADTHMTVNTVLFLETKSVLVALKDAGARIGIISTKYRYRIQELLDLHFPGNFLDIIVGGEDVKAAKPSPEGLLFAIKQLHTTKAETLYIGDSTVDAETAQAAGVDFAGVTHGVTTAQELQQYPHKKIMSSLDELLDKEIVVNEEAKESCKISSHTRQQTTSRWTRYKTLLRAIHIKMIRGKVSPPNSNQVTTCLNCGTTYTGNYCNRCGQSCHTPHYRLSNAFKNILGGFTNIDNGFGRTLIDLLYRPGYMIKNFIEGKRIIYFRPFQTLFVLAALYIMCVQLVDPDALNRKRSVAPVTQSSPDTTAVASLKVTFGEDEDFIDNAIASGSSVTQKVERFFDDSPFLLKVWNLLKSWGHGNKAFRIIATLPLFALATLWAFRRKKYQINYNLTEHVFVQAFIACQILLISIIVLPFYGEARVNNLYEVPTLFIFFLFCWDYKQLYCCSWWRSFWGTLLMFFYSFVLLMLFATLIILLVIGAIYVLKAI